jgi:ADP-heptose:LPS heptosyltransferase
VLEKLKQALRGRKETPAFRIPGQIDDGSRILVLVDRDLAALVFHAPLIAAIRRTFPGASIDFLVPEAFAPAVIPSGLARQVLVYGERQLTSWKPNHRNLQRTLAGGGYDVSIVAATGPRPALEGLGLAAGAVLRLGPSHDEAWPAVNLELRGGTDGMYMGDRLRQLAPFLGLESLEHRTGWPLPSDKVRQAAQLVHFNKPRPEEWLIGVDPGADRSGRAVALENLEFVVSQLRSQIPCRVLPLSSPGQEERLQTFESRLTSPVPPAFNRDTLLETLLLLGQCNLFLAGNTDLLHAAVGLRVPSVGLFGAHVEACWRPAGPRCAVLPVARGEKLDIATLMDTVQEVVGTDGAATSDDRPAQPGPAPGAGPLPAPGA